MKVGVNMGRTGNMPTVAIQSKINELQKQIEFIANLDRTIINYQMSESITRNLTELKEDYMNVLEFRTNK